MQPKPTSNAKRDANRKNAQKSTGPRTPQGKARASCNALKHGLLARSIVLDDGDPNESPEDFANLTNALLDDYKPATAHERLLIERLAVCYWRLRRAHRFETRSIANLRDPAKRPTATAFRAAMGIKHDPTEHIIPATDDLNKLLRYESMIDRELHRTLNHLHRLQTTSPRPPPNHAHNRDGKEAAPSPATADQHPATTPHAPNEPTARPRHHAPCAKRTHRTPTPPRPPHQHPPGHFDPNAATEESRPERPKGLIPPLIPTRTCRLSGVDSPHPSPLPLNPPDLKR